MSFSGGGGDDDGGGGRQLSNNYGTTTTNKRYAKQTPDRWVVTLSTWNKLVIDNILSVNSIRKSFVLLVGLTLSLPFAECFQKKSKIACIYCTIPDLITDPSYPHSIIYTLSCCSMLSITIIVSDLTHTGRCSSQQLSS